jgi:hypothetical protein
MPDIAIEISGPGFSLRLLAYPSYEEWCKNRRVQPCTVSMCNYSTALNAYQNKQARMVKEYMKAVNPKEKTKSKKKGR